MVVRLIDGRDEPEERGSVRPAKIMNEANESA